MAMASRPSSAGTIEIEAADDFVLTANTSITSATFTGLLPASSLLSDVTDVRVEIYRVFPKDSTFPPDGVVPTRTNSPSDTEVVLAIEAPNENTIHQPEKPRSAAAGRMIMKSREARIR
jgi:hypothetical protein